MSAAPQGTLILVTGANGFIASHVVDQLLAQKYKVRGTVRSEGKAKWMTEKFDSAYGKGAFTVTTVSDLAAPGAFDEAVKGAVGICHVASPAKLTPELENIDIAVNGTLSLLASAAKEPSVKRVVVTSSSCASTVAMPDTKKHLGPDTWNVDSEKIAYAAEDHPAKGFMTYATSKAHAEKEAWRFMREKKPAFVLNTVLPNYTIGAIFNAEQGGSTAGWIRGIWQGKQEDIDTFKTLILPQWFVSVRDIARLHVGGIMYDDVENQRLYGFATPFNFNSIVATMKSMDPSRKLPDPIPDLGADIMTVDNKSAVDVLNRISGHSKGFDTLETAIRDNVSIE